MAVIADALWPKPKRRKKRAITEEEHLRIIGAEKNLEQRNYYEMVWLTGGSQTDIARLTAENVDRKQMLLIYQRCKRRADDPPSRLRIGPKLAEILDRLPQSGPLFPRIRLGDCRYRAAEFGRRCKTLDITGVSLHSYRYAWAQRAKKANYPERAAMNALGHQSKAVHRAYAEAGDPEIPSLEEFEMSPEEKGEIIRLPTRPTRDESATLSTALEMLAQNPALAETIVRLGATLKPTASAAIS